MSDVLFDTSKATELAKFQGTFAGIQAGNASYTGVAMAPTSIYNQAGYYAFQDSDTGYISLQKLSDDSLYTYNWYDQGTGTIFDFTTDGAGAVSTTSSDDDDDSSSSLSASDIASAYTSTSSSTSSSSSGTTTTTASSSDSSNSTSTTSSSSGSTSTTSSSSSTSTTSSTDSDSDTDETELTAEDLQELVDAGVYDNLSEALQVTLANGYTVSDEEQAKLGLYSDSDETKIQLMMSKYGLTREEAVDTLEDNDTIADSDTLTQSQYLKDQLESVQDDQGFIGKAWNGIKEGIESFFDTNIGVTHDDCEYAIEQYEAGEISYDEALNVIEEYSSRQESVTDGVKTAASVAAGAAIGLGTGGLGLVVGAAAGAAVKTGLGIADRASNENDDDDGFNKEVVSDAATGAVAGLAGSAGGKVVKGVLKGGAKIASGILGIFKK